MKSLPLTSVQNGGQFEYCFRSRGVNDDSINISRFLYVFTFDSERRDALRPKSQCIRALSGTETRKEFTGSCKVQNVSVKVFEHTNDSVICSLSVSHIYPV